MKSDYKIISEYNEEQLGKDRRSRISQVSMYADSAHFIFEILQNSDDAGATEVVFDLSSERLVIEHNGKPFSEADVKAISYFGQGKGSRTEEQEITPIGRFGLGFKSVFTYTASPHIYSGAEAFKITNLYTLEAARRPDDLAENRTRIVLPFDHENLKPIYIERFKQGNQAENEISEKLSQIGHETLLFTRNLNKIIWRFGEVENRQAGYYERKFDSIEDNIKEVTITTESDEKRHFLVFDQPLGANYQEARGRLVQLAYRLSDSILAGGTIKGVEDAKLFVFFKTAIDTHTSLIIQGPYRTTPARDNIPENDKYNKDLVKQTALLLQASLEYLEKEGLLSFAALCTLPLNYQKFPNVSFFYPLHTAAREALKEKNLLPKSINGFVSAENVKIAYRDDILDIIDDVQLSKLFGRNFHWLSKGIRSYDLLYKTLVGVRRVQQYNFQRVEWDLEPLVTGIEASADELAEKMDVTFFENQNIDWIKTFIRFLSRNPPQSFLVLPFVRLSSGKHVRPLEGGKQQVYLRMEGNFTEPVDLPTLSPELSDDPEILKFLADKFRIGPPVLADFVLKTILPKYTGSRIDIDLISWMQHFQLIVSAFKKTDSIEKRNELLTSLGNTPHLLGLTAGSSQPLRFVKPSQLYLSTPDAELYFRGNPDFFITPPRIYDDEAQEYLSKIHVGEIPRMQDSPQNFGDVTLVSWHGSHKKGLNGFNPGWKVDGLEWALCQNPPTVALSLFIWNLVLEYSKGVRGTIRSSSRANYSGNPRDEIELSATGKLLTELLWLPNLQGEFFRPSNITFNDLAEEFKSNEPAARILSEQLGMKKPLEQEAINLLSKGNVRIKNIAEYLMAASEEALREFEKIIKNSNPSGPGVLGKYSEELTLQVPSPVKERTVLANITKKISDIEASAVLPVEPAADDGSDDDVLVPAPIDYTKKIQSAERRYASEIADLERSRILMNKADTFGKYTYGWFLALLELECLASAEKNSEGKEISIRFGKVSFNADCTISLSQPDRHIPQAIEEYSNVRVDLRTSTGDKSLQIASFNARESELLGRLKADFTPADFKHVKVLEARISIQNPSFLLDALFQRFLELGLELGKKLPEQDKMAFNLKANLTKNINFVFGPPGTGKTTHLARKVLQLAQSERVKILVLTPTNKAADVLIERIMTEMGEDKSFKDWLVRFGSASEKIVQKDILKNRDFNINAQLRSVVVTTIARFAYDGFSSSPLRDLDWNYIVIDEASMIPIANIIYPLYRCTEANFVIAGDPFQIEPIVSVDKWKGQNIYTFVGLDNFETPTTEPHTYEVTKLLTQYRSVPAIGNIFSKFAYDGKLTHFRQDSDRLKLDSIQEIKALTIIKFNVEKYESIYRSKRLNGGTSYQIYSAIFTFEFVRWLRDRIQEVERSRKVRIGIVAPYRAQADIVSRLADSLAQDAGNVEVQVGSVHGFQGDECDIIVAVLNPPPSISTSDQMFLNKKNILNVAISRARDYLVLVIPDDKTEGYDNLKRLKRIKELFEEERENFTERTAASFEHVIFQNDTFLEKNIFSTGHQMVNVYRRPDFRYDVRCDNFAVDVQVHSEAFFEALKSPRGVDVIEDAQAMDSVVPES